MLYSVKKVGHSLYIECQKATGSFRIVSQQAPSRRTEEEDDPGGRVYAAGLCPTVEGLGPLSREHDEPPLRVSILGPPAGCGLLHCRYSADHRTKSRALALRSFWHVRSSEYRSGWSRIVVYLFRKRK